MARTKRLSKARKGSMRGKGKRVRRVQSKRVGKKRTKRSSKSSSRSNKRMRRSFIKKSRGRSKRSLRRMRGGGNTPKYQYWKEENAHERDVQRELALKGDSTSGFGGISKWEKILAKRENNYVNTLRASKEKPQLVPLAEDHHDTLVLYKNSWPPLLNGMTEWVDPKSIYNSEQ